MAKTQSLIRKIILSVLSLAVIGCGKMESFKPSSPPFVDFSFVPYLEQYKIDKKHYLGTDSVTPIEIVFHSVRQDGDDGVCWTQPSGRVIGIDPWVWFNSTDDDRIVLLYHELGHCDLGIMKHAITNTIMNEYDISGWQFSTNRDFYLYTLFIERR